MHPRSKPGIAEEPETQQMPDRMTSAPKHAGTTLAFDTSAGHCAAAVLRDGEIVIARGEDMTRGQAERLVPLLEEVLDEAGLAWSDIERIGVGVGPGNFTGIRISVATARGLALGLGVPAIGVTTFDAIASTTPGDTAVPAPRDQVYLSRVGQAPELVPKDQAGSATPPPPPPELAAAIARCAAAADPTECPAPAPFYLRPADAAPSRDLPPALLD